MNKLLAGVLIFLGFVITFSCGLWIGRKYGLLKERVSWSGSYPVFVKRDRWTNRGNWSFGVLRNWGLDYLEVVKKDGNKITVKFPDGSTQELSFSSDTLVYTQSKASLDDIKEGDKIMIKGKAGFGGVIIVQK